MANMTYEQRRDDEREDRRRFGPASGCYVIASMLSVRILHWMLGKSVLVPILPLFVIGPLAAWAAYHWWDPARDAVVLAAYRLRGKWD